MLVLLAHIGLVISLVMLVGSGASAEYRLASGDVIEVSVFGVQDYNRRAKVNVDGEVSLPLLGYIQAAGRTLPELRAKLKDALIKSNIIRAPDVTAELVEHRPFYINGHIAHPGAHPYQPGLTVRHAVALAGGFDVMRFKVDNPLMVAAELRSQYEVVWTEYVRREARVTTLQAELDDREAPDLSKLNDAPVARRIIAELVKLELDHFSTRKTDEQKERAYLERALKHAQDQVTSLFAGREQEILGVELQTESVKRTSVLSKQGLAPINRLTQEQRDVALQKSRQLETGARLAEARRIAEEFGRRVERVDDDRRMRLIRELQDAVLELERARSQLQGIGEKLLYIGAIKAQAMSGGRNLPEIAIYRRVDGQQTRLAADENTDVYPGDVIDIIFSQRQLILTGAQ